MARSGYAGRHRFGSPGLVHVRAVLGRTDQPRGRRWWRLQVLPAAKHGGTVIPLPVRSVPLFAGRRAA